MKGKLMAKKEALQKLKRAMHGMGDEKPKMMKAIVTAKDAEGLKEGLEKGAELMDKAEDTQLEGEDYEAMSREEMIERLRQLEK